MKYTKSLIAIIGSIIAIALTGCGNAADSPDASTTAAVEMIVEAGCAKCTYGMEGSDTCETALKIGDTPYLLTGAKLDAMSVGLCRAAKQVTVAGSVQDGKFVAESIALLDDHSGHKH